MDGGILVPPPRTSHAADPRAHPLARQAGVPSPVCSADMVDDESPSTSWRWSFASCWVARPTATTFIGAIRARALKGTDDKIGKDAILEPMKSMAISAPRARWRRPSPCRSRTSSRSGRGTATGREGEQGVIKSKQMWIVSIVPTQKTTVTGVEMFKKSLNEGQAGDNCGLPLRSLKRDQVQRGQVLCKPGSITPHKKFEARSRLNKDEGGRHTPFFSNYRPQFFMRTGHLPATSPSPVVPRW